MKINICYDSSWRNSFLGGSNNEPVPKKGRKYIASITSLKNEENFIQRDVSKDTVMGVLNRLIGDQRKLYQSRQDVLYYFADIEDKISYQDKSVTTQEMTYLRNISGSTDQNSFTGAIKSNDVMFDADYSKEFWGVLAFDLAQLLEFIIKGNVITNSIALDPISIVNRLESLNKEKAIIQNESVARALTIFQDNFGDVNYLNKKKEVVVISLYTSALYLQLKKLSTKYDMTSAKTKAGGISGISKRGFTKKDFMDRFTTGEKKKIWGNPYIYETFVKGQGKTKNLMSKASGTLEIMLDVPKEKAKEIRTMVNDAGVSSFYLGKKGLAFVNGKISVKELS